jgi:hypothetical protein
VIGVTLPVGMADGADDEADAGAVESLSVSLRLTGIPAAMLAASRRIRFSPLPQGRSPASRLAMADCQSMWASSVVPPVTGAAVVTKRAKSSRCSQPAPMTRSQAVSREWRARRRRRGQHQRVRVPRVWRWSWQVLFLGGGDRQLADADGQPDFLAQPGDLVVLGGDPGQGLAAEAGEFADRGV